MSSKKTISIKTALNKYNLNEKQITAVECIKNNKITILRGVAGTAKTFSAVYAALKLLNEGSVERIAITRPLVTTEKMGFLPGDIADKIDPFLYPIIEFFNKLGDSGDATFKSLIDNHKIRRAPVAFMRGTTIENEILLVDEAQNLSAEQMLMVLTRLGKNGKIVITGDEKQVDLGYNLTGLDYVIALSRKLPYVQQITLTENMRDEVINEIVEEWSNLKDHWLTGN